MPDHSFISKSKFLWDCNGPKLLWMFVPRLGRLVPFVVTPQKCPCYIKYPRQRKGTHKPIQPSRRVHYCNHEQTPSNKR